MYLYIRGHVDAYGFNALKKLEREKSSRALLESRHTTLDRPVSGTVFQKREAANARDPGIEISCLSLASNTDSIL